MSSFLQQEASDPKNSAWVFASAGSGKTKILTDRVLRLLLEGISPNKILCLTFTNAAASEMEKRINSALGEWVICDDAKLEKQLHDLTGNFPNADEIKKARRLFVKILDSDSKIRVQTIHAFCQTLIKIFPFEAGVKPNFELLEDNQEKLLLKQAQQELRRKAQNDETLKNLITKITATLHEESLVELTSELLDKKGKLLLLKERFFGIEGVIAEIFSRFGFHKNDDEEKIFSEFFQKLDSKKHLQLSQSLRQTASVRNIDTAQKIEDFFQQQNLKKFPLYHSAFLTDAGKIRDTGKKFSDENKKQFENFAQQAQEFGEKINSLKIARDSSNLLRLTDAILEIYTQLKTRRSLLDYNDLIIESNRLLENSQYRDWIKMKMDSGFDHILVDESQDTNHMQWNIIKALSEDFFSGLSAASKTRSIFIVGDEKQSIFSFQGSDANISAEIFSYFAEKLGKNLKKIELTNSFRSKKEILAAVDKVFADETRQNAITKAGKFKEHQVTRSGSGLVEIWPQVKLEKQQTDKNNLEWEIDFSKDAEEKEAAIMAKMVTAKIQNLVKTQHRNYGDVMILLRNRTNKFLAELIKIFHQCKIPFTSISKINFSENLLIQDLLAAAKFALLPHDDLNLAALLKSPFFLISEEELLAICLKKNEEKITLFNSIESEEIKKTLDEIIKKSRELNCFEFFYFLLCQKNYRQKFMMYFGAESAEILDKFLLYIFEFQKNFSPNLQKFLEFVEKIDPQISLSDEGGNVVKITTVHSSKGLQAPIVFMPDCSHNLRRTTKDKILWIADLPIWCGRASCQTTLIHSAKELRYDESFEEYLRLLYVAMTRAADELYIGGFGKESVADCWYEIIKNSLPENLLSDLPSTEIDAIITEKPSAQNLLSEINNIQIEKRPPNQLNLGQIKGEIIHKILEIFGKNYREEKSWLKNIAHKIAHKSELLDDKDKNEITALAFSFIDSPLFSEIFEGDVKCEIEIADSGNLWRLDLLAEKENEVLLIDYKSDESAPDMVPEQYIMQLQNYKKLATKIYPAKKIRTAILWLRSLRLTFID